MGTNTFQFSGGNVVEGCQGDGFSTASSKSPLAAEHSKLRVLSLFAGIGGFDLGLERTGGFETVAFCEIEPFARRVLNKHWPEVPVYHDVRELTSEQLAADGISIDVIVGGFPCQDISYAGNGAGLAGERSGLFFEVARLIGELGPSYVILENVAALLSRGLADVLGTLASLGYDAEWHCIPASALGASHRRDRIWIVAYPQHRGVSVGRRDENARQAIGRPGRVQGDDASGLREQAATLVANAAGERCGEAGQHRPDKSEERASGSGEALADPASIGHPRPGVLTQWCRPETNGARQAAYALAGGELGEWSPEPDVGRVANGVPDRAHRLRCLGNAVVPQIPELIGNAILQSFQNTRHGRSDTDRFSAPKFICAHSAEVIDV